MRIRKRRSDRCGRPPLRSPGRPTASTRSERQLFWTFIVAGMSSEAAAIGAGVSQPVGTRWFRKAGGMPPAMFRLAAKPLSGRYLSLAEREEIALLLVQGHSLQEIGRQVGRSASTISREVRRNATTRSGGLGLSRHRRPVACRAIRPPSQGTQACRERSVALLCGGEARRRRAHQRGKVGSRARGVVEGTPARTTTGSAMGMGLEPGTDRSAPGRRLPG